MHPQEFALIIIGAVNALVPVLRPEAAIRAIVALVPEDRLPTAEDGTPIDRVALANLLIELRQPEHPFWSVSAAGPATLPSDAPPAPDADADLTPADPAPLTPAPDVDAADLTPADAPPDAPPAPEGAGEESLS